MSRLLDDDELDRQLTDLPGWSREGGWLRVAYDTADVAVAVRLAAEIEDEAAVMSHHPRVRVIGRTVEVRSSTPAAGGVTQRDVELGHRAREWAIRLGAVPPGPAEVSPS